MNRSFGVWTCRDPRNHVLDRGRILQGLPWGFAILWHVEWSILIWVTLNGGGGSTRRCGLLATMTGATKSIGIILDFDLFRPTVSLTLTASPLLAVLAVRGGGNTPVVRYVFQGYFMNLFHAVNHNGHMLQSIVQLDASLCNDRAFGARSPSAGVATSLTSLLLWRQCDRRGRRN